MFQVLFVNAVVSSAVFLLFSARLFAIAVDTIGVSVVLYGSQVLAQYSHTQSSAGVSKTLSACSIECVPWVRAGACVRGVYKLLAE